MRVHSQKLVRVSPLTVDPLIANGMSGSTGLLVPAPVVVEASDEAVTLQLHQKERGKSVSLWTRTKWSLAIQFLVPKRTNALMVCGLHGTTGRSAQPPVAAASDLAAG